MRKIKRWVSIVIIFTFVTTIFNWNIQWIYANTGKSLRVVKENQKYKITRNNVDFEWDRVINAVSYTISYKNEYIQTVSQETANTNAAIEGLAPGIIYEFKLNAKNSTGTELIGENADYRENVLTTIAGFKANKIDEVVFENNTEIGSNPGLNLKWKKPLYINNDTLGSVPDRYIDYEINIRKSKSSTADTVERFRVEYSALDGQYHLKCWNGNSFSDVSAESELLYNLVNNDAELGFNWTKEADKVNGIQKESALQPGSIYYMQIYPRFNQDGVFADTKYVETELEGDFATTYLHIKLARHSLDNAVMTVYRVRNDGTFITLPNFLYEFWVGPNSNNLNRAFFEREDDAGVGVETYIEAYLPNSANFLNYYMVTATADEENDAGRAIELTSQPLHVNLSVVEATLPPMPENIEIVNVALDSDKQTPVIKIRWDKPSNYNDMISETDDQKYFYHILLNTAIDNLYDDFNRPITENLYDSEGKHLGNFEIKYRKAISVEVKQDDSSLPEHQRLRIISAVQVKPGELSTGKDRIEYTLVGKNLFDGMNYPRELLLNTVYYLKIYAERTSEADSLNSNQTLPITFTTPRHRENKPPLPLHANITEIGDRYIKIAWERIEIQPGEYFPSGIPIVHYEVSVSQKKERKVIEANDLSENGAGKYGEFKEPLFTITSEDETSLVTFFPSEKGKAREVRINGDDPTDSDKTLDPNTAYYIVLRTKLVVEDGSYDSKYSAYSQTLTATTLKSDIKKPDDDEKRPLAPDDFTLAEDANGNKMVDSYSATFTWRDQNTPNKMQYPQGNVVYEILRTDMSIENVRNWDGGPETLPNNEYNPVLIDHADIIKAYSPTSKKFTLKVDDLSANKVYFFSIRATRVITTDNGQIKINSEWITIPVTTVILEAPTSLRVIQPDEEDKYDKGFDIRRNLKIIWKADRAYDPYNPQQYGFDIAIRAEGDADYRIISTVPGRSTARSEGITELVTWQSSSVTETAGWWHGAFLTGLKPGMRYYIKIRAIDINGNSESKYTFVVSSRTEFDPDNYEDDEREKNNDAIFMDSINRYRDALFWIYENRETSSNVYYRIKLRGSKVINYLQNTKDDELYINLITAMSEDSDRNAAYTVYIPINVVETLNRTGKTLNVRTFNGDFVFRPGALDTNNTEAIQEMMHRKQTRPSVQEVYVCINLSELRDSSTYRSTGGEEIISRITLMEAQAQAFSIKDDDFEKMIHEELYGEDGTGGTNGIIYKHRQELKRVNPYADQLEEEILELLDKIEEELAAYISDIIEDGYNVKYSSRISQTYKPLLVYLNYKAVEIDNNSTISGYMSKDRNRQWTKVPGENLLFRRATMFEINELDGIRLAVLKKSSILYDLYGNENREEIQQMNNRYNLDDALFSNGYIQPDAKTTVREVILLFERVVQERKVEYQDPDLVRRAQQYSLEKGLNLNRLDSNITREQACFGAMKLYAVKSNADIENMVTNKTIILTDEREISKHLYRYIIVGIDMGILQTENGAFRPKEGVTRAEFIMMLKRVLDILGR